MMYVWQEKINKYSESKNILKYSNEKFMRVGKATVIELQPGIAAIDIYLKFDRVVSL
jgi:hypothetical protein